MGFLDKHIYTHIYNTCVMNNPQQKSKRYSILKTEKREQLLNQLEKYPEFSGMSVSMIFENLLLIASQNPRISLLSQETKSLADDQKQLRDFQTELFAILGKGLQEISQRLEKIEDVLNIQKKRSSSFSLNIFEDEE